MLLKPTPTSAFGAPGAARDQQPESPHSDPTPTVGSHLATFTAVLLPFAGLVAAIWLLWGIAFSWVYLGLMLGMYLVTVLGIGVGYHRYFTHRSFDTPRPVAFILGVMGSMAVEGSLLNWVATHRRHHQHSDDEKDPHSPHAFGSGAWGVFKGFLHAHMGWFFGPTPDGRISRYAADLRKEKYILAVSNLFPLWVLIGLLIPAALGGILTLTWTGVLLGFIWGGLARIFLVHHATWSINSVCHLWGTRPFISHDESRNNAILAILGFGEGWHNNHHAFPTSARHGLKWWQIDLNYLFIRALALIGLARNIRTPAPERVKAKLRASVP